MTNLVGTVQPATVKRPEGRAFVRFSLVAGLFLCAVLSVYAQAPAAGEPTRLTPGMAVDLMIRNNLNLETARLGLDIKERKARLVWNEYLPSLALTGTLSGDNYKNKAGGMAAIPNTGTPITVGGVSGWYQPDIFSSDPITLPKWHVLGNFSAELTFSFALIQGIRSIKEDYLAGLIGLDKVKLQMEQGVRKMYNQILLLEANAVLLEENYTNAQRQASIAEANFRAGLAPRLTWLQAQVAVENIRPVINDMENGLKSLKGNFAMFLGLPFDTPLELEPIPLEDFYVPEDVAELIRQAASGKPDLKELQANIVTMQTQRKALRLQAYTPFIRFGWNLSTMFNPALSPFKESWFKSENWNGGGNFNVTIGWSLNSLFSFTKEGQQRKDLETGIQIQNIQLAQKIRETELEVFTKVNSLEKILTTKEAQQSAVNLAEEAYRLTEEAYRAGLQDFQAVRSAALALEQARLQLLTQQFNYLNDLIDLEYSIGVPFGTLSSAGTGN